VKAKIDNFDLRHSSPSDTLSVTSPVSFGSESFASLLGSVAVRFYCTFPFKTELLNAGFHRLSEGNDDRDLSFSIPQKHFLFLSRTISDRPKSHFMVLAVRIRSHVMFFAFP
jgi:hypothetical protein